MSELAAPAGLERAPGWARLLPDDRLVRRAAAGDEHAFAAIFGRYHQRLYRYCMAIVGRSEDAHDALQNTMVKVLRALPGEERRMELKPWLYRIAHNESIDLLRRRRDAPELDAELQDTGSNLAEEAEARERLGRLLTDLEALPERQRGALVMRELGGLDFAEIGVALGTTSAVARQTLYEARLGLRQMDEGRGMSCKTVSKALSDGDGRVVRRRDIRAHLRTCTDCRHFGEEIKGRQRDLAALSPLPAVAAAGLLQSLLGGAGGGGGGGGLAAAAGGAANTLGGSALLKGAATVAVVAAVGVGAADRGGLIDLGAGRGGTPPPARSSDSSPAPGGSKAPPAAITGAGAAEVDERADASPAAGERGSEGSGVRDARSTDLGRSQEPGSQEPGRSQERGSQQQSPVSEPAETPVTSTALDAAAEHSHGKGHEKQHPSAAAHGQETAAAHKNGGNGPAAGKGSGKSSGSGKSAGAGKPAEAGQGQAGQPPKPVHPTHPSNPGGEKAESSPPPAAVPPVPEAEAADPAPEADGEAPAGKEKGKLPGH